MNDAIAVKTSESHMFVRESETVVDRKKAPYTILSPFRFNLFLIVHLDKVSCLFWLRIC